MTRPGAALTRRLAAAEREATQLRVLLSDARAELAERTRERDGRDATIRRLEVERETLAGRANELAEALAQACATPATAIIERDVYRAALADIEAVLHRLGTSCGFGHGGEPA